MCQHQPVKTSATAKDISAWEIADILNLYGDHYCLNHPLPASHLKVIHSISVCRTSYLGGHIDKCDNCGFEQPSYNSCRNRHCPKCQSTRSGKWLQDRMSELLPVTYFHNVFTLPHELNPVALCNQKVVFDILFKAVADTLLQFGSNPENRLGGKLGFISVLHTWDQTLMDHFHLHCLIPGGALSFDNSKWIPSNDNYLFKVELLSVVFRGKFLDLLSRAYNNGKLIFPGQTQYLSNANAFDRLIRDLRKKNWVVYSKKPFAGPEQVLKYLARYTHRVAISNHRIIDIQDGKITFTYKIRKKNNKSKTKTMTLDADEFIRRFLLHLLPDKFYRIRYFGFLCNRYRKQNLSLIRSIIDSSLSTPQPQELSAQELIYQLTGINVSKCPKCNEGTMIFAGIIPTAFGSPYSNGFNNQQYFDSS